MGNSAQILFCEIFWQIYGVNQILNNLEAWSLSTFLSRTIGHVLTWFCSTTELWAAGTTAHHPKVLWGLASVSSHVSTLNATRGLHSCVRSSLARISCCKQWRAILRFRMTMYSKHVLIWIPVCHYKQQWTLLLRCLDSVYYKYKWWNIACPRQLMCTGLGSSTTAMEGDLFFLK